MLLVNVKRPYSEYPNDEEASGEVIADVGSTVLKVYCTKQTNSYKDSDDNMFSLSK